MQQSPTSGMAHQDITTKPTEIVCYRCRTCQMVFTSSQGLAGHTRKHLSQGTLMKGETHERFLWPSTNLPALYRELGRRKSTPTILPGQGRFYRPRPRKPVVQVPQNLSDLPQNIFDQTQQEMEQVPYVVGPAPTSTPIPAPVSVPAPSIFSPQLIQAFVGPNEIPFNQIAPLATAPLVSIPPSIESINVNSQEKDLDLELRL
ncbi:hypothetical protein FXO38_31755 [Capsicum annuum]|nr:hypothetical protein FXO38_31755 [Capsicum annuum]KAF3638027.1 hypothetical protein FXO37_24575 [Capsicum annuum]